jgi:hypothetical protein
MTVLLEGRPAGLDALFRPGNTFTRAFNWPAGSLSGRTFTASLDAAQLTLAIDGDVMTITASAAQTTAAAVQGTFTLTEVTGGLDQVLLVGKWEGSDNAATSSTGDVTIDTSTGTVEITVAAAIASPEVVHDWDLDGWDPFTPVVISDDDPQVFDLTVASGRGVITGSVADNGNHRVAYLREGTLWADSEITSVIYGPGGTAWTGTNGQQGHLHRVREVEPGVWEAIAAWTAVFGGGYETINTRAVRFDGATLFQGDGDIATSADIPFIDRRLAIVSKERTTGFGLFFNNMGVTPAHLYGLAGGDIVTVDSTDATMDQTDIAVNGATPGTGVVQVVEPTTLSTSALAVDRGHITPSGVSRSKRWVPYVMSTRVVGGDATAAVLELKRWRLGDPEPDWSDPRVQRQDVTANAGVPTVPTEPGLCALWAAHFFGGSTGTFGGLRFRQIQGGS